MPTVREYSGGHRVRARHAVIALLAAASVVAIAPSVSRSGSAGAAGGDRFACRASAVRVGSSEPVVANGNRMPCVTQSTSAVSAPANGLVEAVVPTATTNGDAHVADAAIEEVHLFNSIVLKGLHASAVASCGGVVPSASGGSSVTTMTVGGTPVAVGDSPLDVVIPGIGTLSLNSSANEAGTHTQRAAWFRPALAGLPEIVVGEAIAGATPDACTPPTTGPPGTTMPTTPTSTPGSTTTTRPGGGTTTTTRAGGTTTTTGGGGGGPTTTAGSNGGPGDTGSGGEVPTLVLGEMLGLASLAVSPPIGPPGQVTQVVGTGLPPDTDVVLQWTTGLGKTTARTDATGNLRAGMLVFPHDRTGLRMLEATIGGASQASAFYLVVPATMEPPRFLWRR